MKAQPIRCDDCGRIIGARRLHMLTGSTVRCLKCFTNPGTHGRAFPHCSRTWHDMHDHGHQLASRAAAAQIAEAVQR